MTMHLKEAKAKSKDEHFIRKERDPLARLNTRIALCFIDKHGLTCRESKRGRYARPLAVKRHGGEPSVVSDQPVHSTCRRWLAKMRRADEADSNFWPRRV